MPFSSKITEFEETAKMAPEPSYFIDSPEVLNLFIFQVFLGIEEASIH